MLNSEEVLPIGRVLGDVELHRGLLVRAPGITAEVGALTANASLVDLEPVAIATVGRGGAGRTRHVGQTGSWVEHGATGGKPEADASTGGDLSRLGAAGAVERALVAAHVIHVGRRVVPSVDPFDRVVERGTTGLPNVLVSAGLAAVDDELVKPVVCVGP